MKNQKSKGDFSPNIIGDNNLTNEGNSNVKQCVGYKFRYTIMGFVLGVLTSFLGSYLYDWYKSDVQMKKNDVELLINDSIFSSDRMKE